MKKIVVLSDTHGNISAIEKLLDIMKESDYVFHLGDFSKDIELYRRELGDKLYSVQGNCDGGGKEIIVDIDGYKIMLVHGDVYGVKTSLTPLYMRALELGVKTVFYGHTHQADVSNFNGVELINPGCMAKLSQKSYCYAVLVENKLVAKIVEIKG